MSAENFNPAQNFRYDFPAAVVVFLVALPLCLGVALASGVSMFSGIIAGAVGGIVIGLLSKSPLSVSGPAAGLTVIVLAAVKQFPAFETFLLVVFLAGLFQVVLGLLKAGVIGDFIPSSVIKGMLAAIGIILILKQLPHAVGVDKDYEGDFFFQQLDGENTFSEIWHAFDAQFTPGAILIALLSLSFLFWWDATGPRRKGWARLIPGPLAVVLVSVGLNALFRQYFPALAITQEHLVNIPVPDSAAAFFGQFRTLSFAQILNPDVWKAALTISLVASVETLLSIEAIDKLDPFKRTTPTNRELLAQGVGNMAAGLLGGMPVTSVIVRSSANVSSGARTKASTILHGLMLILSVALIPSLLNLIPLSALAAVLIATGYKLAKPTVFKYEYMRGWAHIVPFVVTIVAILFTDLLIGVLVGIAVGGVFVTLSNYRSAVTVVHNDANSYLIRVRKDLSFIHKLELKRAFESIPNNSRVWLSIGKMEFVDLDNAEIINDFITSTQFRDIELHINTAHMKEKMRQHIKWPTVP
ncbi:MAG TPA: SulP family inorganic anion transporter, partial [Saprospiraceae bacterium]|nr:SulP family inorganic anion transporter [Saprospiraceae bacterium]